MTSTILMTTTNNHIGGYFYQINSLLVINETSQTGTKLTDRLIDLYNKYEFVQKDS